MGEFFKPGKVEFGTCLASDDYNGLIRCRIFFWEK